ncbi:Rhomboid domain-containing protein [Mycena venus]|uniref:Rhomboid domain-containing protein n=1 Tax=Mycena venus TaxID=2733690 RepID=A0A8H6YCS2_9AGAR|nr:Rhomboid domain-containing protein [Mycena venus]
MFRLGSAILRPPSSITGSSSLRFQSPRFPCRSYFRTAFLAAKHRSRVPVANLKLPSSANTKTRLSPTTPSPTRVTPPPVEPAPQHPEPTSSYPVEKDSRSPHSARNQLLFSGSVICGVFLWAAVQTNTLTDEWVEKITHGHGTEGLDNRTLVRAKAYELAQKLKRWGNWVAQLTENLSPIPRSAIRETYVDAAQKLVNAPDAMKACWGICAVNGAVFIAWHVPRLADFMSANFLHRPLSGRARTLLTSVFSHHSFFHLLFNSMALLSFGAAVGHYLYVAQPATSNRLESTTGYHFLAMFISAGLVSSLASHMLRVRIYDRIVASLSKMPGPIVRPIVGSSLGASGAIYACVTIAAMAYPEATVSPIFIPIGIPIRLGVGALAMMDVIGLIRGWRVFDHIAHLGGAVFGLWYYMYGPALWARWRAIGAYLFSKTPKGAKLVED